MKGGPLKKEYDILIWSLYVIVPIIGWYLHGIITAIIGIILAYLFDLFFPKWKSNLTWKDINIAFDNIYKYGSTPCELCFLVNKRKVYIYRDEQDFTRKGQPPLSGFEIRMSVRIPVNDWNDIFDYDGRKKLFEKFGGYSMYSTNRGAESFGIFPRDGKEGCKKILELLFDKAVGGLQPDICAQALVNSKRIIWIEHSKEE